MTSIADMTATSLPSFTSPKIKAMLGSIIVTSALVGLPTLLIIINYLRSAADRHGQAINRCDRVSNTHPPTMYRQSTVVR